MIFLYAKYLPLVLILSMLFIFMLWRFEKRYFSWIKKYWFFRQSIFSKMRFFFFSLGLLLLSLSLLDLRGPEETITGEIPDQKTVILIDTSASMLAEDIRPNRLQKALVLARHFVKQVVGHQIALAVFSDTTIQVTPFTDDPNFLDAKLQALESLNPRNGGTSLVQALNEAIQILRVHAGQSKVAGNLVVFTDSEDNGDMTKLMIPETVNVAFIGVGTREGGKVPVKGKNGEFLYNKKYQGQEVISKLDEDKIKELGKGIKNFKYWVALSYSLPTEEIEAFLKQKFQSSLQTGQMKVQPVLTHWLLIPGISLLALSYFAELIPAFTIVLVLSLFVSGTPNGIAAEESPAAKEEKPQMSPLYLQLESKMKAGEADQSQRLKMAEELLRAGQFDKSTLLYNENYDELSSDDVTFNYGMSKLLGTDPLGGFQILAQLKEKLEQTGGSDQLLEKIQENIARFFKEKAKPQDQKKDDQKKDDQKKDDQKKEDQKKEDQKKDDQKKDDQKKDDQQKDDQKKDDQKKDDQKKDDQQKDDQKKDDQKKEDQKKEDQKKEEQKNQDKQKKSQGTPLQQLEQKEKELRQKRKMKQIPGIINQIMDDDQMIMKQLLDASSAQPHSDQKDW